MLVHLTSDTINFSLGQLRNGDQTMDEQLRAAMPASSSYEAPVVLLGQIMCWTSWKVVSSILLISKSRASLGSRIDSPQDSKVDRTYTVSTDGAGLMHGDTSSRHIRYNGTCMCI